MDPILARASGRLLIAQDILDQLQLMERWRPFGKPLLVGAVAYGLVVAPDIDLEIYCEQPRIEDGFAVLQACALHPRTRSVKFANELDGPDQGLYWQLHFLHESGVEWKIDMWSLRHDHPGPTAASLVGPMNQALTAEKRRVILELKEQSLLDPGVGCPSIHVYRAVLEAGVRSMEGLKAWLGENQVEGLVRWKPDL